MKYYLALFTALSLSVAASEPTLDCENAITTLDINQCAAQDLQTANTVMHTYLKTSYQHNKHDPELIEAIKLAQKDWQNYMASHCDSVYTQWRDGTIRGVMAISCKTKLTKQRTHEIWQNFLTYMDSTPPVLPEPKDE
ncbi:lysozyme inhibitor LprI family protein [Marinomonas shanghaiensis]|uniref:lysozyme inhibitor LprI family protein n=1 Tax=Marinomonas shanghaiensis TaxID=2202418 RepID=UPI003A926C2B